MALTHAIPRVGAVVVPLSPRLGARELAGALRALDITLVVCDATTTALAATAIDETGRLAEAVDFQALTDSPATGAETDETRLGRDGGREHDEWAVLWTSGTAGRPRGVSLTVANLRASATACGRRLGLQTDDRWYLSLSLAHVGGLALVTRAALLGSAVVARGPFSVEAFRTLTSSATVSHVSLVPTMLAHVLDAGVEASPELRCVLVGGARTPLALVERAQAAGFPVALTYGLTEATSQVATAAPGAVPDVPDTVGEPLPGVEVRISDSGEILVRGPTIAATYVGSPEPLVDAQGWLHTGDLGAIDARGSLRVTGRIGDRIISGGSNVDPLEVEEVLRAHPAVADAAVTGVPDEEWGELVVAAVVRRTDSTLDSEDLTDHIRAHLGGAKIPRQVRFINAVPRNPNGKIDRGGLRVLFVAGAVARGPDEHGG